MFLPKETGATWQQLAAASCSQQQPATDRLSKKMKINDFFKNEKAPKNVFTERNGNNNNHHKSAGRRFLTEKLRLCSRNTVKRNRKHNRHAQGSSTIIYIKKQQHSTTTTTTKQLESAHFGDFGRRGGAHFVGWQRTFRHRLRR